MTNNLLYLKDPQAAALSLLIHTPLFAGVSPTTLRTLAAAATLREYAPEARLFLAGEPPEFLHILVRGSVQLIASTPDGREAVVELLRPIDTFILAAVLTSQPYLMSARAVEPTQVLLLPTHLLLGELKSNPELALALLGTMAQKWRHMVREIKGLRLRTASQRLALFLLQLVEEEGTDQVARLPHDKRLLASRLGMTPESFSRASAELRRHGVDIRGESVHITDPESLREYCRLDQVLDTLERDLRVMLPSEEQLQEEFKIQE